MDSRLFRMVVKEIKDGLLEEMEFGWWFEQDINGESEDDNEKKFVTPHQDRNARRDKKRNHHNTLVSI
ncbi:hypothetical protein Tco_0154770 [Tanacetum coccineum]